MKAKLFENSHYEGWEPIIYTTYAVATAIIVFGVGNKPDTDIKSVSIAVFGEVNWN